MKGDSIAKSNAFEIANGEKKHLLRAPKVDDADHAMWLQTIRDAVTDCLLAEAMASSPLTIFGVSAALSESAKELKVNTRVNERYKSANCLLNFMREVKR